MKNSYNYKRIEARKASLALFIVAMFVLGLSIFIIPKIEVINIIPLIIMIFCAIIPLYHAFKKTHAIVEDDRFEIIGKTIGIGQIKQIDIKEQRIDVIVEKGIFPLTSHLHMTNKCFDTIEDWNNFKKDMEHLKTKLL